MAENSNFRTLYLQDGSSFFNNFFAFHFISMSSFRIIYFLCHKRQLKICLLHRDVISPPKTVKIKKQKRYDCLE